MPQIDKETELRFNNFFMLFRQDGWKELIEDLTDDYNNLNEVRNIQDEKQLYYTRGRLEILGQLINLERTTNLAHEELQADNAFKNDPVEYESGWS